MSSNDEKEQAADDDDVCTKGVSVQFLLDFSRKVNLSWSTHNVCEELVKPATKSKQLAYYELIQNEKDENGNSIVAEANYFCSHVWRYKFRNVVDALKMFCKKNELNPEDTYIWLDLFINNQHLAPSRSYKWWCGRFKEAIKNFGKVILVIDHWTDPRPIKRAWCLWEIFCTVDTESEFHVAMCEAQHRDFQVKLVRNFEDVRTNLTRIDARKAEASVERDRDQIFAAIEKAVGFSKLNERVIEKMREWLLKSGEEHLKETEAEMGEHIYTYKIYTCLAKLYRDMTKYDKAEKLFRIAERGFMNIEGEDSTYALEATNGLAFCLQKQGFVKEAIEIHKRCLESRTRLFKELDKGTTQTMSNLAGAFRLDGQLEEAKTLFKKAVECRDKTRGLGPNHPATLYTVTEYAHTLTVCGDYELAKQFHKRAVNGLWKFFNGRKHPLTLNAIHCMGYHMMQTNQLDDALELLMEAYHGRLELFGEEGKLTKETKLVLVDLLEVLNKAGKKLEFEDLPTKRIERFLQDKKRRRQLWEKACTYLKFKARVRMSMVNVLDPQSSPTPTPTPPPLLEITRCGSVIGILHEKDGSGESCNEMGDSVIILHSEKDDDNDEESKTPL